MTKQIVLKLALSIAATLSVANAYAFNTCEELFATGTDGNPTQVSEDIIEVLQNSSGSQAELQAFKMFSQMTDSADAKLSSFILELGRNPLLSSSYSSLPEAETLNTKLAKDVVRLQKATTANPNLFEKVLRKLKIHNEKYVNSVEMRVQQGHFDVTQAVAQMTKENEFYAQTEQELAASLTGLKNKISITQDLIRHLESAQAFGSLSDHTRASIKTTIVPHLASALGNMVSIYNVTTAFSEGLAPRIATNNHLINEIQTITVQLAAATVMTAKQSVDLKAKNLNGSKGFAPDSSEKYNAALKSNQEVFTMWGPGRVVTFFKSGEIAVLIHEQGITVTPIRAEIGVYQDGMSTGGFKIGEEVNVSGKYFATIKAILPGGDVLVEVKIVSDSEDRYRRKAFAKASLKDLVKVEHDNASFAHQFTLPFSLDQSVATRDGIGHVVEIYPDASARIKFTSVNSPNKIYKLKKLGLTTKGLKSGNYSIGDAIIHQGIPYRVMGAFENGDLFLSHMSNLTDTYANFEVLSPAKIDKNVHQTRGTLEGFTADFNNGTMALAKDGFEGRVVGIRAKDRSVVLAGPFTHAFGNFRTYSVDNVMPTEGQKK